MDLFLDVLCEKSPKTYPSIPLRSEWDLPIINNQYLIINWSVGEYAFSNSPLLPIVHYNNEWGYRGFMHTKLAAFDAFLNHYICGFFIVKSR